MTDAWTPSIAITRKKTTKTCAPHITVIQVAPTEGYYWDTRHGTAVAGAKMLVGAMIGKTLDDSIEGTLRM